MTSPKEVHEKHECLMKIVEVIGSSHRNQLARVPLKTLQAIEQHLAKPYPTPTAAAPAEKTEVGTTTN